MGEKEDIVSRLEALRRKVPEDKEKPAVAAPPPEEKKRKKARVIGLVVIGIVLLGLVSFLGYTFVIKPQQQEAAMERARQLELQRQQEALLKQKELLAKELALAKDSKIDEINEAFEGLPEAYDAKKLELIKNVDESETKEEVMKVDVEGAATEALASYWIAEAEEMSKGDKRLSIEVRTEIPDIFGAFFSMAANETNDTMANLTTELLGEMYITETYSGDLETIKEIVSELIYPDQRIVRMKITDFVTVPLKLTRLQAALGLIKPGDIVDVYYKTPTGTNEISGETTYETKLITGGARVITILSAKATGTISMTESETMSDAGGGVEGKGTATSLGIGGTASLTGAFEGSAGTKTRTKSSVYTVDIAEIQKAAAASKISESYLTEMLTDYGIKLADFERETGLADFDTEYLLLLEVPRDKVQETLQFSILQEGATGYYSDIILTIPTKQQPEWMREIS